MRAHLCNILVFLNYAHELYIAVIIFTIKQKTELYWYQDQIHAGTNTMQIIVP